MVLIQHCMAEWSEGNDVLVFTDETSSSFSLDMMRSSVSTLVCWAVYTILEITRIQHISKLYVASVFDLPLTCKLKSPTIRSF